MIYSERDWLRTEVLEGDGLLIGIQIEMNTRRLGNVLMYIKGLVITQLKLIPATLTKLCAASQLLTKFYLLRLACLISKIFFEETKRGEQRQV